MTTETTATGREATLALAKRFLNAVNTKDADALIETVSRTCVYELWARAGADLSTGTTGSAQPSPALVAVWPDYDFVIERLDADETMFVAEWTMTGTLASRCPSARVSRSRPAGPTPSAASTSARWPTARSRRKTSYVDATAWYEQLTFAD